MKRSQAGLVGRRVWSSFRTRLWAHALIAGTMAIALFVFGAFMLAEQNLQSLFRSWANQVQVYAYLDKALSPTEVTLLQDRIQNFPEVERIRHISQEQAWKDFRAVLGPQSNILMVFRRTSCLRRLKSWSSRFTGMVRPLKHWPVGCAEKGNYRCRVSAGSGRPTKSRDSRVIEWAKWAVGGILFVITFLSLAAWCD